MICRSISFYQRMFVHTCKLEWNAVRDVAKDWQYQIERKWPRYGDEIQGMSDSMLFG
jgi:isopenicillin-N N-acyltransferase-like protein